MSVDRQKRNEQIRMEYEAGASLRDLGAKYGINWTNIRRAILAAGGTTRSPGAPSPAKPPKGLLGWLFDVHE